MEAEIITSDTGPRSLEYPPSPSIGSVTSVASSVDDLTLEVKYQHKKKIIFTAIVIVVACIFLGVSIFGAHEAAKHGLKSASGGVLITADMVLPNTTLDAEIVSDSKTKGSIYFYDSELTPNELGFSFSSFFNATHDVVAFVAHAEDVSELENAYLSVLNGMCGFEIDLIGAEGENPHNSSKYGDHTSSLVVSLFGCDAERSIVKSVVWEHNSLNTTAPDTADTTDATDASAASGDNEESAESSGENGPTSGNVTALEEMAYGKVGQYFVELSIKLGSKQYMGRDMKSVSYIVQYAIFFWKLCDANEKLCNWETSVLREAVTLTNQIISANRNNSQSAGKSEDNNIVSDDSSDTSHQAGTGKVKVDTGSDGSSRRLQQTCSSTNWWWVGDGYCDASKNTIACGFDGGDCCAASCKNGVNWEASNGNSYAGYTCGAAGYNCLPGCSVTNPSWLGDGYCDKTGGYNTDACNYDNGDCCEEGCNDGTYTCGVNGYDCQESEPTWCERNHCGNTCLGMCGADCDCWEWTCGDCHCHGECSEHDTYCSCDSLFAFWCVNVFWINCDDGSIAVF